MELTFVSVKDHFILHCSSKRVFLLRYNSLPFGTECLLRWPQAIGQCPRKMDEIMMARCLSTVGEPRSKIPHAPHLFALVALCTDMHFIARKRSEFLYRYTCHWILKLHQFLYFIT